MSQNLSSVIFSYLPKHFWTHRRTIYWWNKISPLQIICVICWFPTVLLVPLYGGGWFQGEISCLGWRWYFIQLSGIVKVGRIKMTASNHRSFKNRLVLPFTITLIKQDIVLCIGREIPSEVDGSIWTNREKLWRLKYSEKHTQTFALFPKGKFIKIVWLSPIMFLLVDRGGSYLYVWIS